MFPSKTCPKEYTEETTGSVGSDGITKGNDKKFKTGEPCMQKHLFEHFYSDGHNDFLKDVAINSSKKLMAKIAKTGKTIE